MKVKNGFFLTLLVLLLAPLAMGTTKSSTQNYDAQFLDKMTQHHREGVEMAKIANSKASSQQVKDMSQKMMMDQQKEIEQMQEWRKEYFSKVPKSTQMPKKMDMSSLRTATADEFDKTYLSLMSKHHKSGIDMFEEAQVKASNKQIQEFARKGAQKQSQEVKEMEHIGHE
jgi:uncharacterized protein (DUF305 family)